MGGTRLGWVIAVATVACERDLPETPAVRSPDAPARDAANEQRLGVDRYDEAIVGRWTKVDSAVVGRDGTRKIASSPDGFEQKLEFAADGTFSSTRTGLGKLHRIDGAYRMEDATVRMGDNDPLSIQIGRASCRERV